MGRERLIAKIGRNEPCPCGKTKPDGSPVKYKHCHGAIAHAGSAPRITTLEEHRAIALALSQHEAREAIRERQQGLGRPITGVKTDHHQLIAVKNKIYWGKWRTFPDFLQDYIKTTIGSDWGNAELAKPLEERHQIIQWYDAYCRFQRTAGDGEGEVKSAQVTGIVACYLMLAYNLYLIGHNAELQERMIARLRNPDQFQGAYYELMVASILIRAGFDLTLIDETNGDSKNCEFVAVSKETGKTYWIEAKMRAVSGLMGKTDANGSPDPNPLSHLVRHVSGAIAKPAADERMIFVDVNAELAVDIGPDNPPSFMEDAEKKLERYAFTNMPEGEKAYVFVTCTSFHRDLEGLARMITFPYGLGIPDFNFRGPMRMSDRYRQNKRHPDAIAVGEALMRYLDIPATFDGELPSEKFHGGGRVLIGLTYAFGEGKDAIVGTVTSATVMETDKMMVVGISTPDGANHIGQLPMTDEELHDYRQHKDAYFGEVRRAPGNLKTPFDMFEWLMDVSKATPRQQMLDWFAPHRNKVGLEALSDEDLLIEYCDALTAVMMAREQKARRKPVVETPNGDDK